MTQTRRVVIASHDDFELVTYQPCGETRIDHAPTQTCSAWMTTAEIHEVCDDPSVMTRWATDEPMGMVRRMR